MTDRQTHIKNIFRTSLAITVEVSAQHVHYLKSPVDISNVYSNLLGAKPVTTVGCQVVKKKGLTQGWETFYQNHFRKQVFIKIHSVLLQQHLI